MIKVLEGTQGIGVVLCETTKAAESVIEAFMGLKQNIMVGDTSRKRAVPTSAASSSATRSSRR